MKKFYLIICALVAIITTNAATFSGTVPVMYIYTKNSAAITSKDTYIDANFYIDPKSSGYAATGSASSTVAMKIRGRGNTSWTDYDKKPYRFKLTVGIKLLDMPKSKNYCLLAYADDDLAFIRGAMGFKLSECLNLAYTPRYRPVEVMLNGSYIGLYFLTESVRIDKDRVAITKQEDNETDASLITGGWLLEMDNADDVGQVKITEGNGNTMRFAYKDPEELSSAQTNYLTSQLNSMDDAIYATDKNSTTWESYINMDTLARYYIVQEIMDNTEAFHGSTYLYKQRGSANIWSFGPVWDFANAYRRSEQQFIYQNSPFTQHWIAEIAKYPRFQQKVRDLWAEFYKNQYATLSTFIDSYVSSISSAIASDYQRWPSYGTSNATTKKAEFKQLLEARVKWLNTQWDPAGIDEITIDKNNAPVEYYNLQGIKVENPEKGLYIRIQGDKATKVIL